MIFFSFQITFVLLTTLFHIGFSEPPSYFSMPFRPSQQYPPIDRIQSPVPAKEYGPPKPMYGVPNRPDESTEPTTPPNNFKGVPSKFNSQNFQTLGQTQNLPEKDHRGTTVVFPSRQMSAQQFNQLSQQQLPGFNNEQFRPQQKFQKFTSNSFSGQLLPNPVQSHTFNAKKFAAQFIQSPQNFQQLPFRNFNVEIQRSQEFQLRSAGSTSSPPSNFNFNNQNSVNVQNPSLFNINVRPKQKTGRNNQQVQPTSNLGQSALKLPKFNAQAEFLDKNQFPNDKMLAAKRASSGRRGGKVTAAPSRQYLSPEPTTPKSVVSPPPVVRRRPTPTAATETENVSIF